MNNYKYKKNNIAFDQRLKEVVSKLKREFNNGKIKTETEYAYCVKQSVIDFYNNLGKPSFKLHKASDVPSLPHYINMMNSAKADMLTILLGCTAIGESLYVSENEMNDTMDILTKRTNGVLADVSNLEKKIRSLRNAKDVVFADSFITDVNQYKNTETEYSTFADVTDGMLTLGPIQNRNISKSFDIEILNSSNGFPGNTHEVYYSISNLMNNNIRYKGESNPNMNLSSILNENSSNDWFEFEMFNLDDDVINKTSNVGFMYKEDISWVTTNEILILNLKLYCDNPVRCNFIKISGIPKLNSNISNPIVKNVTISDEIAEVQKIVVDSELTENTIVSFSSQLVKSITIEIEQKDGYLADVCRQYALNIDPSRLLYSQNNDFKNYIQMEQPKSSRPSIELLGLKYNQKTSSLEYPSTKDENNFITQEYVKSQLFYNNKISNNLKVQSEVVKAKRYSIGVKNISIKVKKFLENGIYISNTFISEYPIKTITFNSDDYIPDSFKNYISENESFDDYIKYYISFDDGSIWHNINPRHKAHVGPCTIVVNSNAMVINRNKNISYIDMLNDPSTFSVKIELKRPTNLTDETPIVYGYNLEVSSEEGI